MVISRPAALAVLTVMPLFFSSNIIFGRAAVDEVGPFTLAFLRWLLTALVLAVIGRVQPALRDQSFELARQLNYTPTVPMHLIDRVTAPAVRQARR